MKISSWLLTLALLVTVINYPNPFNPQGGQSATIKCTADTTTDSTLYIYNLSAQLVTKKSFPLTAGAASYLTWNGYTDANERAATGLYIYQLIDTNRNRLAKGKIWVINK